MAKDNKFFNCSEKHEIDYLASKFFGQKEDILLKIKELCNTKKIHYSTHKEVEKLLIDAGFEKK
ncbi:MAG: hypothetical protein QM489_06605 [Candidatus Izemoplasma sp.]